jgi:AI-2 transport protein TqsA
MGNVFASFGAPARGLIVAAAIAIIIAATRLAGPLLAPLLLAIFTAIVLTPMLRWMSRHRVPKWLSLPIILFLLMDLGSLLLLMTTGALEGLRDSLPSYQERFLLLSSQMGDWLEGLGIEGSSAALPDIFDPNEAMRGVRFLLSNVGSLAATGVLVLMAVIFLLLETASLPDKLKLAFRMTPGGEARLQGTAVRHQPLHDHQVPDQPGNRGPYRSLALAAGTGFHRSLGGAGLPAEFRALRRVHLHGHSDPALRFG